MNTPYIKQLNELGQVINPIEKSYMSEYPNRRERRHSEKRFTGNTATHCHLTVTGTVKFRRVRQTAITKKGEKHIIYHYLAA